LGMTSLGSSAAVAQTVFDETRQALLEAGAARSLTQACTPGPGRASGQ